MKKQTSRFLILSTIILLMLLAAYAYFIYFNNSIEDTSYLTPIPWKTAQSYKNIYPINSKLKAVVAAQSMLNSSRRIAVNTPIVIYAEQLDYTEAIGTVIPPSVSHKGTNRSDMRVWFVVFEGEWRIEGGPLPELTPTTTLLSASSPTPHPLITRTTSPIHRGCVYVMFHGSETNDVRSVGGIENCEQWKSNQNMETHFELDGTRWLLQLMLGKELLEDTAITLKFEDREITGSAGCNYYWKIIYPHQDDSYDIKQTVMRCNDPIMEQEDQYVRALKQWTSFYVEGESLFVMDEVENILLEYRLLPNFDTNPADLIGKVWRLISADGMEEFELDMFTLWFDGSKFGGTTSCRDYKGTYHPMEDSLNPTFIEMTTEDTDCRQNEAIAEGTYTTLLERTDQYHVSPNRLELYTVQNDKLVFELVSNE